MSLEQRNATIHAFSSDPRIVVFLMSLKAGGVALNLTAASHVMLMDPWWNPVGVRGLTSGCAADCSAGCVVLWSCVAWLVLRLQRATWCSWTQEYGRGILYAGMWTQEYGRRNMDAVYQ